MIRIDNFIFFYVINIDIHLLFIDIHLLKILMSLSNVFQGLKNYNERNDDCLFSKYVSFLSLNLMPISYITINEIIFLILFVDFFFLLNMVDKIMNTERSSHSNPPESKNIIPDILKRRNYDFIYNSKFQVWKLCCVILMEPLYPEEILKVEEPIRELEKEM